MTLVFPDDTFSIKPKANDPQEVDREEVITDSKLVEQVSKECQAFEDDHQAYDISYQDDVRELERQKADFQQMIDTYKNSKFAQTEFYNQGLKNIEDQKKSQIA